MTKNNKASEEPCAQDSSACDNSERSRDSDEPAAENPVLWPMTITETLRLIKSGRRDLLSHLRWQLKQVPELWRKVGNLTDLAVRSWAQQISHDDDLLRESIVMSTEEELEVLRVRLGTETGKVIGERYVLTKLQLAYYDIVSAHSAGESTGSKLGNAILNRHKSANHQFNEAVRQLANVERIQGETLPDEPVPVASSQLKLYRPRNEGVVRKTA
jgi:hypothetical protein